MPEPGVAFQPPPASLLAQATELLQQTTAQLPPGTNGAIVGLATEKGWNAAIVHRVDDHFVVAGWLGKHWGESLTGGAAVRATW